MAVIALSAKVAGDALKGISSAKSAAYNAQVARNNATIERQNAAYSAGAASANTERAGLKARAELAATRAGAAASGVDVNSGSAADVQTSQRELGGLDTATVASKGAEQVYGYQGKATGFQAQANLDQAQVVPDLVGAGLNIVGDVAGGVPSLPSGGGGADPWAAGPPASLIESGGGGGSGIYDWASGNPTSGEFSVPF